MPSYGSENGSTVRFFFFSLSNRLALYVDNLDSLLNQTVVIQPSQFSGPSRGSNIIGLSSKIEQL